MSLPECLIERLRAEQLINLIHHLLLPLGPRRPPLLLLLYLVDYFLLLLSLCSCNLFMIQIVRILIDQVASHAPREDGHWNSLEERAGLVHYYVILLFLIIKLKLISMKLEL